MKQRRLGVAAAIILSLLLTACGAVTNVEDAIESLGTISPDSRPKIEAVQAQYDALEEKQQKKVENYALLEAAWETCIHQENLISDAKALLKLLENVTPESGTDLEKAWALEAQLEAENLSDYVADMEKTLKSCEKKYDAQWNLIREYEDALAKIGEVTLNSKSSISTAEKAYSNLEKSNLSQYVSNEVLIQSRQAYDAMYLQDKYDTIYRLYDMEAYVEALSSINVLESEMGQHQYIDQMRELESRCNIGLARNAFHEGKMEASLDYLARAERLSAVEAEIDDLKEQIEKKIQKNRPANGKKLVSELGSGYGKLTVKAGSSDACVKLESVKNPEKYVLFYIRAESQATISVPDGEYLFKYTAGTTWYSQEEMFGSSGSYAMSDEILVYDTSYSGSYVYYNDMTITLYTVWGGNFDTDDIDESEF